MGDNNLLGMCFGTFDKLHEGHINFFKQAKDNCDKLLVVVARDENVKKIKGSYSSQKEIIRLKNVERNNFVDRAVLGKIKNKVSIIKDFEPDIIFLGYDQKADIEKIKKYSQKKIIRLNPYKSEIYKSSKMK